LEEKTRDRAWVDLAGTGAGCPQRENGKAAIIRNPRRRCFINPPSLEIPNKAQKYMLSGTPSPLLPL
jgi:hypothetical protein